MLAFEALDLYWVLILLALIQFLFAMFLYKHDISPLDLMTDLAIIAKVGSYAIYSLIEVTAKGWLLPGFYLKKSVSGDNVLITGAAGGIGKSLVKKFLKLGASVVCIDVSESALSGLKTELEQEFASCKGRIFCYQLDVSSSDMVAEVAAQIKSTVGKIDILINNAGIMSNAKLFLDLTEKDVNRIFGVNTLAHFWLCREFLPDMLSSNKGNIVNVSSVCGLAGGYKLTDYCASKFAVLGFTESLRCELKLANPDCTGVVVSAVCPFHVKTKLFEGADVKHLKWLGLSMEVEYVTDAIVDGVLRNKELIFIPKGIVHLFAYIKYILPTKAMDYLQQSLDFHGSMDRLKKTK